MQYMKATLIAQAKEVRDDGSIVEIVVWELEVSDESHHRSESQGLCFQRRA